jgi:hypothetical protein
MIIKEERILEWDKEEKMIRIKSEGIKNIIDKWIIFLMQEEVPTAFLEIWIDQIAEWVSENLDRSLRWGGILLKDEEKIELLVEMLNSLYSQRINEEMRKLAEVIVGGIS